MIEVVPTRTRYLEITHTDWDASWRLQIPESIACAEGWIMDFGSIDIDWRHQPGAGASGVDRHSYTWIASDEYVEEQNRLQRLSAPRTYAKEFLAGVTLRVTVESYQSRLLVSLELTNDRNDTLHGVVCDGGCFQARSPLFAGDAEIERTHIRTSGAFASVATLDRSVAERCLYVADAGDYEKRPLDEGGWFWGRSSLRPDRPVTMAMNDTSGDRWVVFGYQDASSGSANADEHHCIHSRPSFGNVGAGQTVTRRGVIAFGEALDEAYAQVCNTTGGRS